MAIGIRRRSPLKVLFIGNSFTARNDLPGLIAQMAATHCKNIEYRLISAGRFGQRLTARDVGGVLDRHW